MKVRFCVKIQYGLWLHGYQGFFFLTRHRLVQNQDIQIASTFSMCDSHGSTEIIAVLSTNIAFDKFSFFCPTVVVACFFMIFPSTVTKSYPFLEIKTSSTDKGFSLSG